MRMLPTIAAVIVTCSSAVAHAQVCVVGADAVRAPHDAGLLKE